MKCLASRQASRNAGLGIVEGHCRCVSRGTLGPGNPGAVGHCRDTMGLCTEGMRLRRHCASAWVIGNGEFSW